MSGILNDTSVRLASFPRRGLSCSEASTYVGLGQTKFLELVGKGQMPEPVRVDRRAIWDIRELDAAFDVLRDGRKDEACEPGNFPGWGDEPI